MKNIKKIEAYTNVQLCLFFLIYFSAVGKNLMTLVYGFLPIAGYPGRGVLHVDPSASLGHTASEPSPPSEFQIPQRLSGTVTVRQEDTSARTFQRLDSVFLFWAQIFLS